jgi:hypothetical protein
MVQWNHEMTAPELEALSPRELHALWLRIRHELEQHDPRTLDQQSSNILFLATFYTITEEELFAQYRREKKRIEGKHPDDLTEEDERKLEYINQWID